MHVQHVDKTWYAASSDAVKLVLLCAKLAKTKLSALREVESDKVECVA